MVAGSEYMPVVATVFGLVWLYINLYTFSPVYRKAFFRLIGRAKDPRVYDEETTLPDDELPSIDVLVPAYDERATIGHAIRSLRAADYPADRLHVNVIVETDDRETRGELARLRGRYDFREVVVPPSYPGTRNKPRALNYGFECTDGDVVGVVDAEDAVAPELFRQVVHALVEGGHDYVQGTLDMQNEGDGALNTLFRGEYGFWYGTVVPSYFRVGYPVPLGGTTNFMTRSVLEDAAAERVARFGSPWTAAERAALTDSGYAGTTPWDPRNVTEDFELGLLLWEMGRDMALVTAVTREESPVGVNAWVRQRTRWQKGKLDTLYHRLRHPPVGVRRKLHVYTQSATPHIGPLNVLGFLVVGVYATAVGFLASPVVAALLIVAAALALQLLTMHTVGYWTVTDERGWRRLVRTGVTVVGVPPYWVLQWGADVRAFVQLAFGHLTWEKTEHTGRHFDEDELDEGVPAGYRVVVTAVGDCWLWLVERGTVEVARAVRSLPSEAAARRAAEGFGDDLLAALGTDAVFAVRRRDDGWTWRLVANGREMPLVVAPQSSLDDSLEEVARTRVAAGLAPVVTRRDDAAEPVELQAATVESSE